ncbi:3-oxoacyl-ACP reductase family protein [Chelativorans intermedius]|uniref:3-oxoacyl-ACP reductase family protein n=1 Tax=Chelativorans intermedius TaxID=515947 RepID=A0ABV6DDF1_9HYPH|nr:3-oxoacyl-ACP reductase family protein [Chelativorans intermedius]MCT9000609.1 3-oxoacyl-ACP reductase FabG [Chelativorans intermedius]
MQDLIGKAALVTGGSRGMGAAIARTLATRGADVAITYLNGMDKARAVVAEIRAYGRKALAIRADSADSAAIVAAVNEAAAGLSRLDILVNNAGIFPHGPLEEVTPEEIDRTLAIHARAVFLASQAALKHMGAGGRIVSIGSSLAWRVPSAGMTLYAMSKAALIGFTKGLARDVGVRGITVNVVDPGPIDTDMNPADGEAADVEKALTALGTYGRPEDVATLVAHLASEAGRNITGASLAIDGGVTA